MLRAFSRSPVRAAPRFARVYLIEFSSTARAGASTAQPVCEEKVNAECGRGISLCSSSLIKNTLSPLANLYFIIIIIMFMIWALLLRVHWANFRTLVRSFVVLLSNSLPCTPRLAQQATNSKIYHKFWPSRQLGALNYFGAAHLQSSSAASPSATARWGKRSTGLPVSSSRRAAVYATIARYFCAHFISLSPIGVGQFAPSLCHNSGFCTSARARTHTPQASHRKKDPLFARLSCNSRDVCAH